MRSGPRPRCIQRPRSCRAGDARPARAVRPAGVAARPAPLTAALVLLAAAAGQTRQVKLIYAGSLIVPFDKLATAFEAAHPGVTVTTESHGSIQVLRHVTELGDQFDLAVTADEQLIPPLMYDRNDPTPASRTPTGTAASPPIAWSSPISPKSPLNGELTSANWYRRVTQPDVRFGLADPRFDAAGYRSLMVLQLAERAYHDPFLFEDM